ncbi:hypothetical protein BTJ40_06835 [Microbulbifer sp. A4B17]|uniref:hypothetical protein n=1 Tax=Microbulbifer sp. A4B17 TaxID=359370 RepID=UPI000D52EBD8|nr:hypothetical protein [Microbulbifer sp. A4B17]AWF80546.1 hypothetical protein BTJ40_06835 [Microbulbifer sp. A4B17]
MKFGSKFKTVACNTLAIAIISIVSPYNLIAKETIGFEFEDYLHAWPNGAPTNSDGIYWPAESKSPKIKLLGDTRAGYTDLEVHMGPFELSNLEAQWYINYLDWYAKTINEATDKTGQFQQIYKYIVADIVQKGSDDEQKGDNGDDNQNPKFTLARVTEFINPNPKKNVYNKKNPPNPTSDVGPQVTFSMETEKVYNFFMDFKNNPFVYQYQIKYVNDIVEWENTNNYDPIEECLEKDKLDQTPYECSKRGRGFAYYLAYYLSNSIAKINYLIANQGDDFIGGDIKKESYPLLLRNQKAINAVKEYYGIIKSNDEFIADNEKDYLSEVAQLLTTVLPDITPGYEMTTNDFVEEYLKFLQSNKKSGFKYGPKGLYGIDKLNFTTLGDIQDLTIKEPNPDSIYTEIRPLRNIYVTEILNLETKDYAIPYGEAVKRADNAAMYLKGLLSD